MNQTDEIITGVEVFKLPCKKRKIKINVTRIKKGKIRIVKDELPKSLLSKS